MNAMKPKSLSLKYKRFTPSAVSKIKEIGIGKFEFVAKTQFLDVNGTTMFSGER